MSVFLIAGGYVLFHQEESGKNSSGQHVFAQESGDDSSGTKQKNGNDPGQDKPKLQEVLFKYKDKEADRVSVVGEFNNWDPNRNPMNQKENGVWKLRINLTPGEVYQYAFFVDGEMVPDPNAPKTDDGSYSLVTVPGGEEVDLPEISSSEKESVNVLFMSLKDRIKALETRMAEMNKTLDKYHQKLMTKDATIRSHRNEIERLREEKTRKETKLVQAKAKVKQLKEKQKDLRDERESYRLQVDKLEKKNKNLTSKYKQLQKKYNQILSKYENDERVQELRKKVERLKQENSALKKQLAEGGKNQAQEPPSGPSSSREEGAGTQENSPEKPPENSGSDGKPAEAGTSGKEASDLPHHSGQVLKTDQGKNIVVIDLWGKHGLEKGATVYAVKNGKVLGALDVFRVFNDKEQKFSFCRPVNEGIFNKLYVGTTVQTYRPGEEEEEAGNDGNEKKKEQTENGE